MATTITPVYGGEMDNPSCVLCIHMLHMCPFLPPFVPVVASLSIRYSRGLRHRFFLELAPVLEKYIEVEKVYNQHNFQVEVGAGCLLPVRPLFGGGLANNS